jgi:ribosome-binding factor A
VLRDTMRDPRLQLLSVTAVEMTGDLQHAKVYVSPVDPATDMDEMGRLLERAASFIRSELGRRHLDLRHLPELKFIHDRSIEQGSHIEDLLRELDHEKKEIE